MCSKCDHHMRIKARRRLETFLDDANRVEIADELEPQDKLKFKDSKKYKDRITAAQNPVERKMLSRYKR